MMMIMIMIIIIIIIIIIIMLTPTKIITCHSIDTVIPSGQSIVLD